MLPFEKHMDISDPQPFRVPKGWLWSFKDYRMLEIKNISGKAASTDVGAAAQSSELLQHLLQKCYSPNQVYNSSSTAVY